MQGPRCHWGSGVRYLDTVRSSFMSSNVVRVMRRFCEREMDEMEENFMGREWQG